MFSGSEGVGRLTDCSVTGTAKKVCRQSKGRSPTVAVHAHVARNGLVRATISIGIDIDSGTKGTNCPPTKSQLSFAVDPVVRPDSRCLSGTGEKGTSTAHDTSAFERSCPSFGRFRSVPAAVYRIDWQGSRLTVRVRRIGFLFTIFLHRVGQWVWRSVYRKMDICSRGQDPLSVI